MPSNYLQWIRKDPRPKSEIFICPFCYGEVWSRTRNEQKEVVCTYSFCPHCGKQIGYEFLPYQRLLQWFALPRDKANGLLLYLMQDHSKRTSEVLEIFKRQCAIHDMCIHPRQWFNTPEEYKEYMQTAVKDNLNSIYGTMKGGDTHASKEENNGSAEGSEENNAR